MFLCQSEAGRKKGLITKSSADMLPGVTNSCPSTEITCATLTLALTENQPETLIHTSTDPLPDHQTKMLGAEVLKQTSVTAPVKSAGSTDHQDNMDVQTVESIKNGIPEHPPHSTDYRPIPVNASNGQIDSTNQLPATPSLVSRCAVTDQISSVNSSTVTNISTLQTSLNSSGMRLPEWSSPHLSDSQEASKEQPSPPLSECGIYAYDDLNRSTNNFDERAVKVGGNLIGSGGFGDVYYACLREFRGEVTEVAVKRFKKPKQGQKALLKYRRQFNTEVYALTRLRHKNIVKLCGLSCDGPELCLAYEYLSNGTLKQALSEKFTNPLLWIHRLQVLRDVADALTYIHKKMELSTVMLKVTTFC